MIDGVCAACAAAWLPSMARVTVYSVALFATDSTQISSSSIWM